MPITREELDSFHAFALEKISNGSADLSWWEMLELWRLEHPSDAERAEMKEIVRRGLEDIEAGLFLSMDEFNAEMDRKYGPCNP